MMETNAQFSMVLLPGDRRESWQGRREHMCWWAQDGILCAVSIVPHNRVGRKAEKTEEAGVLPQGSLW